MNGSNDDDSGCITISGFAYRGKFLEDCSDGGVVTANTNFVLCYHERSFTIPPS